MKQYELIGLTGQSGAGKSTVSAVFSQNGFTVINADYLVHKIYMGNSPCLKILGAVFGYDVITEQGTVNRGILRERAFENAEKTVLLNSIVHPFVLAELQKEIILAVSNGSKFICFDAPQLFESNISIFCDSIVSVVADKQIRLRRICERDNISEELAIKRINAQLSEEFFVENSDYIIENNSDLNELKVKTNAVVNLILKR